MNLPNFFTITEKESLICFHIFTYMDSTVLVNNIYIKRGNSNCNLNKKHIKRRMMMNYFIETLSITKHRSHENNRDSCKGKYNVPNDG